MGLLSYRLVITLFLPFSLSPSLVLFRSCFPRAFFPFLLLLFFLFFLFSNNEQRERRVGAMHPYANRTSESAGGSGCRRDAEMSTCQPHAHATNLFPVRKISPFVIIVKKKKILFPFSTDLYLFLQVSLDNLRFHEVREISILCFVMCVRYFCSAIHFTSETFLSGFLSDNLPFYVPKILPRSSLQSINSSLCNCRAIYSHAQE